MKEPVFILWGILILVLTLSIKWVFKRYGRSLNRYAAYQKIGLLVVTFGLSYLLFFLLPESPHQVWLSRLVVLLLASIDLWVTYRLEFSQRHLQNYREDSVFPEYLYLQSHGVGAAMVFVAGPQVLGLVDMQAVDLSLLYWDLPLVFMLPYLCLKMSDFSGQVPFKMAENRWVYPLEYLPVKDADLKKVVRVEFEIYDGLEREYRFFARSETPWIQAPRKFTLGDIFRITMQERKRRPDLAPINDVGDEHGGAPHFWWLFRRKVRWHPGTWFRLPRYLNPNLTVEANHLKPYDVVVLHRIPAGEDFTSGVPILAPEGPDDTIILQR